jgi:nitrate reductase delta subunit
VRRREAAVLFGCASVLLSYPEEGYAEDLGAVRGALGRLPGSRARARLAAACEALALRSLLEAQADYVDTFDLRRRSLHLTSYRYGEGRERGAALAEMAGTYRSLGLALAPGELPDFLPALLELAAVSPVGATLLAEHRSALEALSEDLGPSGPYAAALEGLLEVLRPRRRLGPLGRRRGARAGGDGARAAPAVGRGRACAAAT